MLRARCRDLDQRESGFTLIELMIVVLVIAILLSIAIPTFLGARTRAQHRATESNLRNALTVERTSFTDNSTYTAVAASLTAIEPNVNYLPGGAVLRPGTNDVAVVLGAATASVCLTGRAQDGQIYSLIDEASGLTPGTWYSTTNIQDGAACDSAVGVAGTQTPLGGGW